MQFRFFKNQEIPEFYYNLDQDKFLAKPSFKSQEEDYVDFSVNLIDNGDEKLCLQVHLAKQKTINMVCSMYNPVFEPCKVMFAGSGYATYIKDLKVRQVPRLDYFKSGLKQGHVECCSIF